MNSNKTPSRTKQSHCTISTALMSPRLRSTCTASPSESESVCPLTSGKPPDSSWLFWPQILSSSDRIKQLKRVSATSSSASDQPRLCSTSLGHRPSLPKGLYTGVRSAGPWRNSLEFESCCDPATLEKPICAALSVSALGIGLWWCSFRRLVMARSSSWVSWRTNWLGCTRR